MEGKGNHTMHQTASLGLLLVAVLAGCQPAPVAVPPFGMSNDFRMLPGQPGPGLVADPQSPIPDVPKPVGFRPIPSLCTASGGGAEGPRRVRHVYQGMGSAGEAVAFFRQQMPARGWQMAALRGGNADTGGNATGADAVLTFTKGPETLDVRVRGGGVTTLTVDIFPRATPPGGGF